MTTSITVRRVPDETRNELAARAARSGRSLQEYLRGKLIEMAAQDDIETWLARVREHKATYGATITTEEILDDLRQDRR